jgi:hypothetical protein
VYLYITVEETSFALVSKRILLADGSQFRRLKMFHFFTHLSVVNYYGPVLKYNLNIERKNCQVNGIFFLENKTEIMQNAMNFLFG